MNLPAESAPDESPDIEGLAVELSVVLERIAWSILRDWPLAADAVQETWLLFAEKFPDIPEAQRRGWLVRTVQYQAHNLRRRQHRAQRLPEALAESGGERFAQRLLAQAAAEEQAVDAALDGEAQYRQLLAAVAALPAEQQAVLWGRMRDEKTFMQLSQELGVPLGTVLSRMRLALEKLRSQLHE